MTKYFHIFAYMCLEKWVQTSLSEQIWWSLFVAIFPCAAYACRCRCGFGGGSEITCPPFPIKVILNILNGDKDEKHEEASEQVQDARDGDKVVRSLTLAEEHHESHTHRLQAPRNAKDEEEFAIENLKDEIDHYLIWLLQHNELVSDSNLKNWKLLLSLFVQESFLISKYNNFSPFVPEVHLLLDSGFWWCCFSWCRISGGQ